VFWKRSILGPLPLPHFHFRFHQNIVILLVVIPPTYLEAADKTNRFRLQTLLQVDRVSFMSKSEMSVDHEVLTANQALYLEILYWYERKSGLETYRDADQHWLP